MALKELINISKQQGVDLLLDIGANTGQFVIKAQKLGLNVPVVSFEPLSSAHLALTAVARRYPRWHVYERCAIGDFDGEIEINISSNSHSSSILEINKVHLQSAPSAMYLSKEKTPIRKLDSIATQLKGEQILLKIDTQGFEDKVLLGAKDKLLSRVKLIQLEMSLVPLYQNALIFPQMLEILTNLGYEPLFYSPGYTDRTTEHIQQIEGYFIKKTYEKGNS